MKKVISILLCTLVFFNCFAIFASATENQDKIKRDMREVMPEIYQPYLWPQIDKIIDQVPVSDAQYLEFRAVLDETVANVSFHVGWTLHQYTEQEQDYLVGQFYKGLAIFNLHCEFVLKTGGDHEGDQIVIIYDADGNILGTLDGDLYPTKTDSAVPAWTLALLGAAALLMGVAFVAARKTDAVAA